MMGHHVDRRQRLEQGRKACLADDALHMPLPQSQRHRHKNLELRLNAALLFDRHVVVLRVQHKVWRTIITTRIMVACARVWYAACLSASPAATGLARRQHTRSTGTETITEKVGGGCGGGARAARASARDCDESTQAHARGIARGGRVNNVQRA